MTYPKTTIPRLQTAADAGASVRALIDIIRAEIGVEATTFAVMSVVTKAFGVSLADIRELPGAKCLGGGVYEDDAIEAVIGPTIARARFGTTGFRQ